MSPGSPCSIPAFPHPAYNNGPAFRRRLSLFPGSSVPQSPSPSARQLALDVLGAVQRGAYADVALHRGLSRCDLGTADRGLATELVYGIVRRRRTLDGLIDHLGKKPARQQPPQLRLILHLGLYQLRFLTGVPAAAAVDTSVELAKANGLGRLAGVVNGVLRAYGRQLTADRPDPWTTADPVQALGLTHSYPDWLVELWQQQLGTAEAAALCAWFNQVPRLDLRVNPLRATVEQVQTALAEAGVTTTPIAGLPQGLGVDGPVGAVTRLPGYREGWWSVQDRSAQLVGHLVNPQPGQVVLDACAAPGGKATHLAELMQNQGQVWACDRTRSRLRKVTDNQRRLGLDCVQPHQGDSAQQPQFAHQGDRVLVDAPCSGLGTLHRHVDARWRQTPTTVAELAALQSTLLAAAAQWVKPGGELVYATCTLHPAENEAVIEHFLAEHPAWSIQPPPPEFPRPALVTTAGWVQVWPHRHQMDGFFMVKLTYPSNGGAGESGARDAK